MRLSQPQVALIPHSHPLAGFDLFEDRSAQRAGTGGCKSLCCDHSLSFFPVLPVPARCSRPKDVANAHIDVGNNTLLNTRLRYTCNPGYKRKAGTSSLIQCILHDGSSKPDWTHTTLQCIRKPLLSSRDAMGTREGGNTFVNGMAEGDAGWCGHCR